MILNLKLIFHMSLERMIEVIIEVENQLNIIFPDDDELNTVVTPGQCMKRKMP